MDVGICWLVCYCNVVVFLLRNWCSVRGLSWNWKMICVNCILVFGRGVWWLF